MINRPYACTANTFHEWYKSRTRSNASLTRPGACFLSTVSTVPGWRRLHVVRALTSPCCTTISGPKPCCLALFLRKRQRKRSLLSWSCLSPTCPFLSVLRSLLRPYLEMITRNPHLPAFILQELRRNPDGLRHFASSALEGVFIRVAADIKEAVRRGEIKPVDPNHLFANLLGLCIFPFIARPMLQAVFEQDDSAYDRFLEERQREVTDFIRHALQP